MNISRQRLSQCSFKELKGQIITNGGINLVSFSPKWAFEYCCVGIFNCWRFIHCLPRLGNSCY